MASDRFQFEQTNLQWQTWNESIPDGAVSIYNESEKRTEYVAKSSRESGFYCPTLDPCCHYSYGGYEHKVSSFEILVNKDNFEVLEWKPGSNGSVPENAVKTVQNLDTYVGKNQYGLGKVHASLGAFYHACGGFEFKYQDYEVLTFSHDVIKEDILDVKYKMDEAQTIMTPPEMISNTTVINKDDHEVKEKTKLRESITESNSWSVNTNLTIGVNTSITAGIPDLVSMTVGTNIETSIGTNHQSFYSKSKTKSVSVIHEVPPKHSATVRMDAQMYTADIPFTAELQRTYRNGTITRTSITGTYKGAQVSEVVAVVEPCVPI